MLHCNKTFIYNASFSYSGILFKLGRFNLFSINSMYRGLFNCHLYQDMYRKLASSFDKVKPGKRGIIMFCAGSTTGITHYPTYCLNHTHQSLPRPYSKSKEGNEAYKTLQLCWMKELLRDIEKITLSLISNLPEGFQKSELISYTNKSYNLVPEELRLYSTFFTSIMCMGSMSNQKDQFCSNNAHVDKGDVVTAILDLGFPIQGGSTFFYSNAINKALKTKTYDLKFQHGHLHIGSFHSVVHSVQASEGIRGSIVFNMKRDIIDFFESDKVPFYNTYRYMESKKEGKKMIN
mgnify:CR=1 FL=1